MKIVKRSLFGPGIVGLNKKLIKDKKYIIKAAPATTSKFGPSGSLKNENIILEQAIDVKPKISKGLFLMRGAAAILLAEE
ncbi:MAG TPA: hypothetical protein VEB60_01050 [Candidatus Paceibacterota bacterium]|nr:hypothetical protein [Candidatus Paceibacterota bacterium]